MFQTIPSDAKSKSLTHDYVGYLDRIIFVTRCGINRNQCSVSLEILT